MPEAIPPRTNLEKELVQIWEQVLQRSPIGIQENFFELGGTSVQAVCIFTKIEELAHMRLPLSLLISAPTVEQLAVSVRPGKPRDRKAFIDPIQPAGDRPPFVCVGGGVLWRALAEHLGHDQPVLHLGLDPEAIHQIIKEPNPLEKLARHMVSALCENQPQGPYYLGGFCCDAVFAYEVARQLKMYGHEIGLLAMFEPFPPVEGRLRQFAKAWKRLNFRIRLRLQELGKTGFGGFPRYAVRRWQGFKRMVSEAHWSFSVRSKVQKQKSPDLFHLVFVAANSYRPKPLDCPTLIFRSQDWPIAACGDPYFGWSKYLSMAADTLEVPGDHEGILSDSKVGVIAAKLKSSMNETRKPERPDFGRKVDIHSKLSLGGSQA